jgi:hypothetical protein
LSLEKQIRLWVWSNLFSSGVCKFFFLVYFGSGFQIIGFQILLGLFNFRFAVGQSSG